MNDLAAAPRAGRPEGREAVRRDATWRMILRAFAGNQLALAGLICRPRAVLLRRARCFYHTDQVHTNLRSRSRRVRAPLGTDDIGYDILGRLMAGGQSTLVIALAVAVVATAIGVVYGASPATRAVWSTRP